MSRMIFPKGFSFGVSTSSYQIEGATDEGGRGASIWDAFCKLPGRVFRGDSGDIACNHYHRLEEDLELLAQLGVKVYRFSIAWPRILPQGTGNPNEAGLQFYDRLFEGLAKRGIVAVPTLYHWDLPKALQEKGGWADRSIVAAFENYARVCAERYQGRAGFWTTINEPWVIAYLGYALGMHAPGISDGAQAAAAHHHLLLAHGAAQAVLKKIDRAAQVGIALNMSHIYPYSGHADDIKAAQLADMQLNASFLDPLVRKSYPAEMARVHADWQSNGSLVHAGDLELIGGVAPDFISINTYHPRYVCSLGRAELARANGYTGGFAAPFSLGLPFVDVEPPGSAKTDMGWIIEPRGLTDLLLRLAKDAPSMPLYISENGCSAIDYADPHGNVNDVERVEYLRGHLQAAHKAIERGVNLRGYWAWSFLDNFEWSFGYSKRFGLVYVDYPSGKRTPKSSYHWYRQVIQQNAVE